MLLEQFRPLDGKVMKTGTHTHSKTRENDVLLIFIFFSSSPFFFCYHDKRPWTLLCIDELKRMMDGCFQQIRNRDYVLRHVEF